ncbi:MAG: hypothetical protein EOO40_02870 [Deltaproteobacteria bacterium]|nr:MAG: hypothetical protein EOO40_02870 [Deltaproteobacteria bacterium]
MPVPFNLATSLLLGASLPPLLRRSEAFRHSFANWALLALALFMALVFTPATTYLVRYFPHWSTLYAFDPQLFPLVERGVGPLSAALVLSYFGVAAGGYAVSRHAILTNQVVWLALPLATGAGIWAVGLWHWQLQVLTVGEFDAFWQGSGTLLHRHRVGAVALLLHLGALVFLALVRRLAARQGQAMRA